MVVAFHAWNPFQIFQAERVAHECDDSVILLERRKSMDFERVFNEDVLRNLRIPVIEVTSKEILDSDGKYDVIVCQTPFRYFESLRRTKRAALQYSLTKERHQHGAWRAMCDLNLVYGEYSRQRIEPLAPCRAIGNPRFEPWFTDGLDPHKLERIKENLDPSKKTLLYLPTWGNLSSVPVFQEEIARLSSQYNLIAKVHHNTDALELDRKTALGEAGLGSIFGASDDSLYLLACSDLVMSDYSGAMFDAINVGKPVVLLQHEPENLSRDKFGLESIEYARRDEIGYVAEAPEKLERCVSETLANPTKFAEANRRLKEECFALETGCAEAGAEALRDLVAGKIGPRPYYQIYLRDDLIEGKQAETKLSKEKALVAKLKTASKIIKSKKKNQLTKHLPALMKRLKVASKTYLQRSVVKVSRKFGDKPALVKFYNFVLPSTWMILASKSLLASGHESGYEFARAAAAKKRGRSIAHFTTLAGRAHDEAGLLQVLEIYNTLPERERARHARHAARAMEALGESEMAAKCLVSSHEFLLSEVMSPTASARRNYLSLLALIRQRFVGTADRLIPMVKLARNHRLQLRKEVATIKSRMGAWYDLLEVANQNAAQEAPACYYDGGIVSLSEVQGAPVVEFMVPTYFGDILSRSAPETHSRVCEFLRGVLDCFAANGFAIVPYHQYWLNIANPSGNYPALSYHTTGERAGWLHLKDSAIPGYYRFDAKGYAGFSSFAALKSLPDAAMSVSEEEVNLAWEEVQETVVRAKASKYKQADEAIKLPDPGFIFFAMQMLDDTVATLAWIPMLTALREIVRDAENSGKKVVVKRHPMCQRVDVAMALATLKSSNAVVISDASIHDLIPNADMVVTVNSGVGFEALLYDKPVITLGASEYGVATTQCRSVPELLSAINSPPAVDLNMTRRFVWLYLNKSVRPDDPKKVVEWIMSQSPLLSINNGAAQSSVDTPA